MSYLAIICFFYANIHATSSVLPSAMELMLRIFTGNKHFREFMFIRDLELDTSTKNNLKLKHKH